MARSRAMDAREPGQIREEAALSESVHAPRGNLAGAPDRRARPEACFDGGCTVHFLQPSLRNRMRRSPLRQRTFGYELVQRKPRTSTMSWS